MPDYDETHVASALEAAGVTAGDTVFSHANLGFFGRPPGPPTELATPFIKALLEQVGQQGTIVAPTFSYSFCWGQEFDPSRTPSVCGAFSEAVRTDPRAVRSLDANFSVAAIGAQAEALTRDAPDHSFGPDAFWARFLEANGKIVNLNFDAGSTFIHYVERELDVPYRFDKAFTGDVVQNDERTRRTFHHFVFDHDRPEHAPDFPKFSTFAVEQGIVKRAPLGRGQVVALSASDVWRVIRQGIRRDPDMLIRGGR